jgi:hypothetical protein
MRLASLASGQLATDLRIRKQSPRGNSRRGETKMKAKNKKHKKLAKGKKLEATKPLRKAGGGGTSSGQQY